MSTPAAEFPFPALQHTSGPVPLAAIDSAIEAVVADHNLIQVILDRYREITAEPYTIPTFEYCYLPYILTRAARRLPGAQTEIIHTWLVDELVTAGDLDDDAMLEFFMHCGLDLGPPILPATLKAFRDPLFDSSAGAWYHLGGLAEAVCESNDPVIRDAFAELSLKFIRQAADGVIQNDAVPHFAYIAAALRIMDAAPLLEKLITKPGLLRRDYEECLAILNDQQSTHPTQKRDLRAELLHQKESLEKWYQERPADWNVNDFEEEFDDDLSPLPDLLDEPNAPILDDDFPHQQPYRNPLQKIGRNDPCPCGSGKKYKKCCGK